jgi:hypothetical protein
VTNVLSTSSATFLRSCLSTVASQVSLSTLAVLPFEELPYYLLDQQYTLSLQTLQHERLRRQLHHRV